MNMFLYTNTGVFFLYRSVFLYIYSEINEVKFSGAEAVFSIIAARMTFDIFGAMETAGDALL